MMNHSQRVFEFQKNISNDEVWLIANRNDIQYLTGFVSLVAEEREALLLVTKTNCYLIHAAFSPVQKIKEITYFQGLFTSKITAHLAEIYATETENLKKMLLDEENLMVSELRIFESFATQNQLSLTKADLRSLEKQRTSKDNQELDLLRQAGSCAAKAWRDFASFLKPGITEEVARQKLEQLLLEHGSQRPAFPTIIAFGANGALPHHQPTNQVLEDNTAVLVDFGATVENYRSDMTRTVWVGSQPSETFLQVEAIIKNAYAAALAAAKVSTPALDIDTAARNVIKKAGYGNQFIHTTGHGVGLDIHETPSINWTNTQPIQAGFVITIEPGIYLDSEFGYRYENTVIITDSTPEEVTKLV